MSERKAWHGVYTATALPFNDDYSVDFDGYAEHVAWLAAVGTHGVCPNGSLGEYQTLSDDERARVVTTAVEASPEGFGVMAGGGAYGTLQSVRWVEQAAEAGAQSILQLPPNTYKADRQAVLNHYQAVSQVGLPIVAYNNPFDTKVDLTPELLAELHGEGYIVAVKEFTGDVRRAYQISELVPELDLLIGTDDVLVELGLAGAVGWIAGYPNALPQSTLELYTLATSGNVADLEKALPMYRDLHSLLRWDSQTEFVQAIKLSMDVVGRKGGISAVGAATRVDVDGSLVAEVDDQQRTSIAAVYAAGEVTGVGGAALAVLEGELAGLTLVGDRDGSGDPVRRRRLQRRIARARAFATAMHRAHPVPRHWDAWLRPDTLVCRCEEVTYGEVCHARDELGATDARTVKLLSRAGMGWCQGRVCGFATARLADPRHTPTADALRPIAKRPLCAPISLGELAAAQQHGPTSAELG